MESFLTTLYFLGTLCLTYSLFMLCILPWDPLSPDGREQDRAKVPKGMRSHSCSFTWNLCSYIFVNNNDLVPMWKALSASNT